MCLKIAYFVVATIFMILQGPFYYRWHNIPIPEKKSDLKEILLNTLGSIVGWGAGYFFLFARLNAGLGNYIPEISDIMVFLLAFYGMTGYLPHVLLVKLNLGVGKSG